MITRWRYFLSTVKHTRWQYYLNAAMITRWHCYFDAMVITRWRYYLICLTAKNVGLQEETINISNPQGKTIGLTEKTGWGTTERERERWTEREKERGREDAVFYE